MIRGEGLLLDMAHATGHSVIKGEPSVEEQLLPRAIAAARRRCRQRWKSERSGDFAWCAKCDRASVRSAVKPNPAAISKAAADTELVTKSAFAFLEQQRFDVPY